MIGGNSLIGDFALIKDMQYALTMCNIANSEKRTQMFKEYDIYKQYLPHFMKKNHFISSNKPF